MNQTEKVQSMLNSEINRLQVLTLKREVALRKFKRSAYIVLLFIATSSIILGCCNVI